MTRALALALLALAATLLPAAAAGAATYPPGKRPHTRVATYARNGITVTRLQTQVDLVAGRLHVSVDARVHNDLRLVRGVTLRVGSCTSGSLGHPACPDALALDVPVAGGRTVRVHRTLTLRAPSRRVDRVRVAIARHGALPRGVRGLYGVLLVNGRAWRGAGNGRTYGLDLTPQSGTSVQRILVDAAAETSTRFRGDVAWTARSAAATTLSTGMAGHALNPDTSIPAGGAASFFDRPDIATAHQPSAFSAVVRTAGGEALATVRLPWPV